MARRSARKSARAGANASARSARPSSRGGGDGDDALDRQSQRGRNKKSGGGAEMAILLGALAVLVIAVIVVYFQKTGEVASHKKSEAARERARDTNVRRAFAAWQEAYQTGREFVTGQAPDTTEEALISPFRGKEHIYNVLFERKFKGKKGKQEQQQITMDKSRLKVMRRGKPTSKDGVGLYYGSGDNDTTPIMLAEKMLPAVEGDKINMGGTITVIVLAEKEGQ